MLFATLLLYQLQLIQLSNLYSDSVEVSSLRRMFSSFHEAKLEVSLVATRTVDLFKSLAFTTEGAILNGKSQV